MKLNRRKFERKSADQLVFCQVDGDEGGPVLNISEGGLCVQMFGLVQQEDLLHFWFSLDLKRRIEASGKLAWVDETGKVAGLNFVNLSVHARERIRGWMSGRGTVEKANGECVPKPAASAEAVAAISAGAHVAKAGELRRWPLGLMNKTSLLQFAGFAESDADAAATPEFSNASGLVPVERYRLATRGQFLRGVLVGIVISAVVAIPVFKYSRSAKPNGNTVQGAPMEIAPANSGAPGGTTAPISTSEIKRSSFVPSTTKKSERSSGSAQSSYSAESPFGSTLARQRAQSHETAGGNTAALSPAQAATGAGKSTKKVAASPQQLWSSVQAGSSKAAVELADLYIRGDGVPVNCDQARVLLLVASQKKNAEAIKKLQDLDKTGCPTDPH